MNGNYRHRVGAPVLFTIAVVTAVLLQSPGLATQAGKVSEADVDADCPPHPHHRTPQQALADHLAAFESGDAVLVACDYDKDAVFVQPGVVAHGRREIESTFAFFFGIAGSQIAVTSKSLTFAKDIALFEYRVDSSHVVVTDGI